ncbi:hypothetical protein F5Y05DRAFT_419628 [Hypoxylon sp. FL0543]|nr:hypothetical protein F5Y05DRAFT_419628 [Hypoxylon sp. FL0543]
MDYYQDLRPEGTLPYPNLIQGFASNNQQAYFMEPKEDVGGPSGGKFRRSKQEEGMETELAKHYPGFGSLSHLYTMERLGKGCHQLVFYRRDRGVVEHGLGRQNEDTFECAKFNILRHPRQHDDNNPNYAAKNPGLVTGMDQAMLNLTNYPFLSHTVMSAPLLPRCVPLESEKIAKEGQFSMPKKSQPEGLTKVFGNTELCLKILYEVAARWDDLSNLTRTCQMFLYRINEVSAHADLTRGNFLNLDFTDDAINEANKKARKAAAEKAEKEDAEKAEKAETDVAEKGEDEKKKKKDEFIKPGSSSFLVFSNVRKRYLGAEDGEDSPNSLGFPAPPKGRYYSPPVERRIVDTYRLLSAINVRGSQIRILHFHSAPFLDLSMLKKCLDELPNLRVLGVHNCELLHFGMTVPLLEAVVARNEERGLSFVRSDFSPFYYYGRQRKSDGKRGEYGVIPSDMGRVDTLRAVTAVLRTAVPLARANGIDWFTPGTGLRKFLDRLPFKLGTVRYILEALFNIDDFQRGVHDSDEDAQWRSEHAEVVTAWEAAMNRSLHSDLVLAVNGAPMDQGQLNATMTLGGDFILVRCASCQAELPSYFFSNESSNRVEEQIQCCGCQLRILLDSQVDNYFQEKKVVVRKLFEDPRITDIETFLTAKRLATEAELNDPRFPFWTMAVKTKEEVQDASCGDFVLDGRPALSDPAESKEIWLWRERVMRAMKFAKNHIVDGPRQARVEVARCQRGIENLNTIYNSGELSSQFDRKKNRNDVDKLVRYIDQVYARCGRGSMTGQYGTTVAADWDTEITKYRERVQAQAGIVKNTGPYNTMWSTWGDLPGKS